MSEQDIRASFDAAELLDSPLLHFTDLGLAERFIEQHGEAFRYVPPWNAWLYYDGRCWVKDDLRRAQQAMVRTVVSLYDEARAETDTDRRDAGDKFAKRSESEVRLRAALTIAQSLTGVPLKPALLDADLYALNCRNGTIDLHTGVLRAHDPADLITKLAPVDYDPAADLDEWERFLEAALPNPERREFAQRMLGYACTGDPIEQVLLLIHGPPATGKSTAIEAVRATLGDYARTADFETFLRRGAVGAPRPDLARLRGARFVSSVETDPERQIAVALVKTITGGDMITARFLYGEDFEYRPQYTLVWAVNSLPEMRGADDAFWRRVLRLPFDQSLAEDQRDPGVKTRLGDPQISGPAILRWLVEGCLEWRRDGLRPPETVTQATRELREEMDPLSGWLEDMTKVQPLAWTATKVLRESYEAWCDSTGDVPVTGRQFTDGLRSRGFASAKRQDKRGWLGVAFATDPASGHLDTFGRQNLVGSP